MFPASTQAGGVHMTMGPLDTCKTPTSTGPVPIPYANMVDGLAKAGDPAAMLVQKKIIDDAAAKGYQAKSATAAIIKSHGDEAGTLGGLVSGQLLDPASYKIQSTDVKLEGKAVIRFMGAPQPNAGANAPVGTHIAPSQSKVLIMG
jgi:hypothetical protein